MKSYSETRRISEWTIVTRGYGKDQTYAVIDERGRIRETDFRSREEAQEWILDQVRGGRA